jgi:hypothetical protein
VISAWRRRLGIAVLAAALLLATTGPARARVLHTVLQDDELALFSPSSLPGFIHTLRWLGVDELRVSAEWAADTPDPAAATAPPLARIADPRQYDGTVGMRMLDRAVRAAAAGGLGVIISPAFSAPSWATRGPSGGGGWFNTDIDVGELAGWEEMLARRYSGHYVPTGASGPLPAVGTFELWNEPNQQGYLAPQWRDGQPVSADWLRAVADAVYPRIKRVDPGATVLLGDTSAVGADAEAGNGGVPPLQFLRRLACVDDQLRPLTTGACAHFQMVPGDGWAQHPYERSAPPWSAPTLPDAAEIGNLDQLQALLDRLVGMHRLAPANAALWLTEQGYESNGQLQDRPWSEAQEAQLNAISEFLAWHDPLVVSFAQFLLRDTLTTEAVVLRALTLNPQAQLAGTWTTGLERQNGTPKPALQMFRAPVVARVVSMSPIASLLPSSPAGAPAELLELWGRARPAHTPVPVVVQVMDDASGVFRDAAQTVTDSNGVFDVRIGVAAGIGVLVRFKWLAPDSSWQTSPATTPLSFP